MSEKSWAGQHYEEEFHFPLWTQIKALAEEKDISYLKASELLAPEYAKSIKLRDEVFEDQMINDRIAFLAQLKKDAN